MNAFTTPIKKEITEADKVKNTAKKFRESIWNGYHTREIEGHKVTEMKEYLFQVIDLWENVTLKKIAKQ